MADVFVSRTVELAEVDAQWARAVSGEPRVVWVVVEAGMGKSALLREWLRRVGDSVTRILAVADEAERALEYALLHQLGGHRASSVRMLASAAARWSIHRWVRTHVYGGEGRREQHPHRT